MQSQNDHIGIPKATQHHKQGLLIPILAILCLICGLQIATQTFAYLFNYQPQLGTHFHHIYPPWAIFEWLTQWYGQFEQAFRLAGSAGILFVSIGFIVLFVVQRVLTNTTRASKKLYGSARWAEKRDIEAAGLLPVKKLLSLKSKTLRDDYVYVGAWQDKKGKTHYLKHHGAEHVLCYAPTRSGKGVALIVPTLLAWGQSAVITDLKGELWSLTAGWRKSYAGNKVIRFEPAAETGTAQWNPLDEIRVGTSYEVGDAQNLATLIVDPDGKGLIDHWQKTSQALLVGLILHVIYKSQKEGTEATLPYVDFILSDPDRDISELWMEMVTNEHTSDGNHRVVSAAAKDMLDRPIEEAGSVLSTTKSYLALYRDPTVGKNVSTSNFKIKDLMHHKYPISLYIVTHPNDKVRLRPLVRIMVNMIIRILADKLAFEQGRPVANYKHRLLLMLDEFPSLGKLEILQESLAFIAGYGIKAYIICQDINQLKSRETGYGHDETITSNCHIQSAFPPNRIETAEYLAKLTGQTTVIKEQVTTSGKRTGLMHGHVTRTAQESQRTLLTADECMRLPAPKKGDNGDIIEPGDMIVYVSGFPAIYGKQPLYFKDPVFQKRAEVQPPKKTDVLIKPIPSIKQTDGNDETQTQVVS